MVCSPCGVPESVLAGVVRKEEKAKKHGSPEMKTEDSANGRLSVSTKLLFKRRGQKAATPLLIDQDVSGG